jgi:hypothetical protein
MNVIKYIRVQEQMAGISSTIVLPTALATLAYLIAFICKFEKVSFMDYSKLIMALIMLAISNML